MAEFAALPLFTDSWVADTAHLTRIERGMYHDLLVLCWRSPQCRIPNELDWISRKLMCSPDEIPVLEKVIKEFMRSTGNYLFQKRLRKEFNYIRHQHELQSARAKSRYNKDKDTSRDDAAQKTRQASGSAPSPSPSPSPSEEKGEESLPPEILTKAVEAYNAVANARTLPKCQRLTDTRKRSLSARLRECGGMSGWLVSMEKLRASPFLTGENGNGWRADFDFVVQAKSFNKLMEGAYDGRNRTSRANGIADAIDDIGERIRERSEDPRYPRSGH